jgi:SAM-dependent methyltransferase
MGDEGIRPFDRFPEKYDEWFERYRWAHVSELAAVRQLMAEGGRGLEVGAGTGRFALPLGIDIGVDPAYRMVQIARRRGLRAVVGRGEELPFVGVCFNVVIIITVICFVPEPQLLLREARRVLGRGGRLVLGFIDGASTLGKEYEAHRRDSTFFRHATFYTAGQVRAFVEDSHFCDIEFRQTLFTHPSKMTTLEPAQEGHGEGGFVVLAARAAGRGEK